MIRAPDEAHVSEPEGDEPVHKRSKSSSAIAGESGMAATPSEAPSASADPAAALEIDLGTSSSSEPRDIAAPVHANAPRSGGDVRTADGDDLAATNDEFELVPQSSAASGIASDPEPEVGQGNLLTDDELLRAVCALVFASPDPISERRLCALLEGPEIGRIRATLSAIRERLAASGLPLEVRAIAGGVQILTTSELGDTVQRLFKQRKAERISAAALETLAVVAYRQPVSKAEVEAIRGVQAGPILRTLIDRGFVRVTGRADVPGHPLQYGTTREFLDRFALGSLEELPRDAELAKD